MIPIIPGIVPFGAVMGSVCAAAKLDLVKTVGMNVLVFAGSAQLAAVELMTRDSASFVVVATGLIINLRFLLYSAAMAPHMQQANGLTKFAVAYTLTDQSYAVVTANHAKLQNNVDTVSFYFGTVALMVLAWHGSVVAGYIFGNFAPVNWALDYAVPLSFVALVVPTLKTKNHVYVTIFASLVSLLLKPLPYNMGLIVTALLAVILGAQLSRKKKSA